MFDPYDTSRITSGLQLFGNVTFWLFWNTGYDALQALDDDGDELLREEELAGLAVWRDANADGVSHPGEVVSLVAAGIIELSTRHVGEDEDDDDVLAYAPLGVDSVTAARVIPTMYCFIPGRAVARSVLLIFAP